MEKTKKVNLTTILLVIALIIIVVYLSGVNVYNFIIIFIENVSLVCYYYI